MCMSLAILEYYIIITGFQLPNFNAWSVLIASKQWNHAIYIIFQSKTQYFCYHDFLQKITPSSNTPHAVHWANETAVIVLISLTDESHPNCIHCSSFGWKCSVKVTIYNWDILSRLLGRFYSLSFYIPHGMKLLRVFSFRYRQFAISVNRRNHSQTNNWWLQQTCPVSLI